MVNEDRENVKKLKIKRCITDCVSHIFITKRSFIKILKSKLWIERHLISDALPPIKYN